MGRVWVGIAVALLTAAIGAVFFLRSLGVFGPIATSADGPAWLGALIGFVFFAAGTAVIVKTIYGGADPSRGELAAGTPAPVRLLYGGFVLAIVVALAILFSWIALGPGERHFSGSGAFLGPSVGRAAFGLVAAAIWVSLGWFGVRWFKRRFARSDA